MIDVQTSNRYRSKVRNTDLFNITLIMRRQSVDLKPLLFLAKNLPKLDVFCRAFLLEPSGCSLVALEV